jgi:hypothetical protein
MQEISLFDGVTEKRGRGRPRKADALTNAQRQAAFRARRKAAGQAVTVTKNSAVVADGYDELVLENDRLREELAQAKRELAELRQAFRVPVGTKWSYRQITAVAERLIRRDKESASKAAHAGETNMKMLAEGCAIGVESFWYALTLGWQNDGDSDRLGALVKGDVTRNKK